MNNIKEQLRKEIEIRYQQSQTNESEHLKYIGFLDACILVGITPAEINKIESKKISNIIDDKNFTLTPEDRAEINRIESSLLNGDYDFNDLTEAPSQ